mgnify:CR=1 FL=1
MNNKKYCTAVVLSAGQGKRMGASVQKQYIELEGKPVIYYTIKAFQDSEIIDDIVLVVGKNQISYEHNGMKYALTVGSGEFKNGAFVSENGFLTLHV